MFFAPKGIPEAALKELRQAFIQTWDDPLFPAEYKQLTAEAADPVTGEEIEEALKNIPNDPKIQKVYRQIIGAGPLPPSR